MAAAFKRILLKLSGEALMGSLPYGTDPERVTDLDARWAAEGWPARVDDTGIALTAEYSAPSAGPPPWFAETPGERNPVARTD